jgi:similar to spore coat protein
MSKSIGVHETLELHELLMFKTICSAKSQLISKLSLDSELKKLLEEDVTKSTQHIEQLKNILS